MKVATIDLEKYRTEGAKVFTGRDRGIEVRQKSKIDELELNSDSVEIIIPETIRSINPSFLEEFLVNVVSKLKEEGFRNKFRFVNKSSRYKIEEDLIEAIDRILRNDTALTK
jgi:hypothetical protein